MKWIFGSFRKDALFLVVPGLIALTIERAHVLQGDFLWYLLVAGFADSGHIYTTVWRTWFHPAERQRSIASWAVPLGVAATFFTWSALKLPFMWSFVIYATIHHNWKQYYGVTRWYETINRHAVRWSGFFSKALMITPVIAYHFRSTSVDGFYSDGDLFLYPNNTLLTLTTFVYAGLVAAWIFCEVRNYRQGYREWNRMLSIALSSSLYFGAFFFGRTEMEVLFPPVFGHGIGYMAMMTLATQRTRPKYFSKFAKGFAVIAGTAASFGLFEFFVERKFINFAPTSNSALEALIIGLYLVPLFSHFIYDRYLWKRAHWEARLVYGIGAHKPAAGVVTLSPQHADDSQTSRTA